MELEPRGFEFKLKIEAGFSSAASESHSERNEDAVLCDKERGIFGVFDGLGGHQAGEVASSIARDCVAQRLRSISENANAEEVEQTMIQALAETNEKIKDEELKDETLRGMGTTATVVYLTKAGDKNVAVVGHLGDSRAYVFSREKGLNQITLDDGIFRDLVEDEESAFLLQKKISNAEIIEDLTPEEQTAFKSRNIVKAALGKGEPEIKIYTIPFEAGKSLILTSDGVHDNLTEREIQEILEKFDEADLRARHLIEAAAARSRDQEHLRAKADDMSAVVVNAEKWQDI